METNENPKTTLRLTDILNRPQSLGEKMKEARWKSLEAHHEITVIHAHSMYLKFMELVKKLPLEESKDYREVADAWLNILSDDDKINIFDAIN